MSRLTSIIVRAGIVLAVPLGGWSTAAAVEAELPMGVSAMFAGSGECAACHFSGSVGGDSGKRGEGKRSALIDASGTDVSMPTEWRPTMMANAAKDPLWQAKVESEVQRNPALRQVIEDKCTTCHMSQARTEAVMGGAAGYTVDQGRLDPLALDGVSCTLCHQIQPDHLGEAGSFSGHYVISDARQIFGPYTEISAQPMIEQLGYTPLFGAHVEDSELCATCHTLFTPYVDDEGDVVGTFPEQTPYLEWKNSEFARRGQQCQHCHMPRLEEAMVIAAKPANLDAQSPFSRHVFVGGNVFMLELLRKHGEEIGVTASDSQFDATIDHTQDQLRTRTARLTVHAGIQQGQGESQLEIAVEVENLAGHKFPAGFPSRRAWLHMRVVDESGEKVFESGAVDAQGRISGLTAQGFAPHRDIITAEDQVQVYETVMADVNGERTHTLLRAARYLKDNRLPPRGFVSGTRGYADIAVHGAAERDLNFNRSEAGEGTGSDRVTYRVDLAGRSGGLVVHVELLYQTVKPDFVDDLLGHSTAAVEELAGYYQQSERTPELIQEAMVEVRIPAPTSVEEESADALPGECGLLQNYPNPFNSQTCIPYLVSDHEREVNVNLYDARGAFVQTLVAGIHAPGRYVVQWDGSDGKGRTMCSGVYFYRLKIGKEIQTKRLVLVR